MNRRGFLKAVGLSPAVAIGVGSLPEGARAEAVPAKPALIIGRYPFNTPSTVLVRLKAVLEQSGAPVALLPDGFQVEYIPGDNG